MRGSALHDEWLGSIELARTRIIKFPSLVFLCGGETTANPDRFNSCRDIFLDYITNNNCGYRQNVILAEQIFRYFQHSDYKDLLDFEQDLAELSSLIVLFSESPGSIAELGSFAVLDTIQDRLLVVIHEDDSDKESFIWRGPAEYLKRIAKEKGQQDPITVYPWRRRTSQEDFLTKNDFEDATDLHETISEILLEVHESELLKKKRLGHIMLLMLELLRVVQLATADELAFFLESLEITHVRLNVRKQMSLLVSLGLAVKRRYRRSDYYFSPQEKPWLSWAFKDSATIRDLNRWKDRFAEYYSSQSVQKTRALRAYMKGGQPTGD